MTCFERTSVLGASSHVAVFNWLEEQKTTSAIEEVANILESVETVNVFRVLLLMFSDKGLKKCEGEWCLAGSTCPGGGICRRSLPRRVP